MDIMDYKLYGFIIGEKIHFHIESRRLYRLPSSSTDKNFIFGSMLLNETMMQLFLYLLQHAHKQKVTKDELLKNIWEENNLSSSTQRLWQVLKNLNKKISLLGLPDDFIAYVKGSGYIIDYSDITPIYYRTNELLPIETRS